jgi:phosphohistidine phosphatase SixA
MLYLIRHAHAGNKRTWEGPDALRPLSERGLRESSGLTALLARHPIDRIRSSPTARCLETVRPLAAALGLKVTEDAGLAVGASVDELMKLLRDPGADGLALCTHGELISEVFDRLGAMGLTTQDVPEGESPRWQKGSVWLLDGIAEGAPVGRYLAPVEEPV